LIAGEGPAGRSPVFGEDSLTGLLNPDKQRKQCGLRQDGDSMRIGGCYRFENRRGRIDFLADPCTAILCRLLRFKSLTRAGARLGFAMRTAGRRRLGFPWQRRANVTAELRAAEHPAHAAAHCIAEEQYSQQQASYCAARHNDSYIIPPSFVPRAICAGGALGKALP